MRTAWLGAALACVSGAAGAGDAVATIATRDQAATHDRAATPEQAIASLWRALSNDPGQAADVAALARLFHADAVVFGARLRDGKPELRVLSGTEFVKSQSTPGKKGFYECEIARSVKRYEHLAVVYSIVESRSRKDEARPDFTGVNSLQLFLGDDGWKIVSLYYHVETSATPAPLEGGVSGRCL
jgi:hypothetical protein